MNEFFLKKLIFEKAFALGFSACGIASAESVAHKDQTHLKKWLQEGKEAQMSYMQNYGDKRSDPRLLVEGACSVLVVALNYYPYIHIPENHPQFALYAYGQDYHIILKEKLQKLFDFISSLVPIEGRIFCDTAPVLEKYWAQQAGIGFIGKNTQLIIPGKGSYFFLGEIISTLDLQPDEPLKNRCGNCKRCIEHCPTEALILGDFTTLDANRCISCQTIENRDYIAPEIASRMDNRVYGCDTCQKVCPWNRFSTPTSIDEFKPSTDFLSLSEDKLKKLTRDEFNRIFRNSAVKRIKYEGLKRNIDIVLKNESES